MVNSVDPDQTAPEVPFVQLFWNFHEIFKIFLCNTNIKYQQRKVKTILQLPKDSLLLKLHKQDQWIVNIILE